MFSSGETGHSGKRMLPSRSPVLVNARQVPPLSLFLARVSRQAGNSQKMALLPNGLKLGCPPTGSYGSALRGSKLSGPAHQGKPLIP